MFKVNACMEFKSSETLLSEELLALRYSTPHIGHFRRMDQAAQSLISSTAERLSAG